MPDDCFYMLPGKNISADCKSADKIGTEIWEKRYLFQCMMIKFKMERFENGYDGN